MRGKLEFSSKRRFKEIRKGSPKLVLLEVFTDKITMTSFFKNESEILNSARREERKIALKVLENGVKKSIPEASIKRNVSISENRFRIFQRELDLSKFEDIWMIGAGKASYQMAESMESILQERIKGGTLVTKYGYGGENLKRINLIEAGHPIPDENSMKAAGETLQLVNEIGSEDLVINLLSGGGSALLCSPVDDITLKEIRDITDLLVSCGASIDEVNSVRKHISKVKGGKLLRAIHPAKVVSLIVSDVVGDDLGVIASGPTAPDETTFEDARKTLEKYSLIDETPKSVLKTLGEGGEETLKEGEFIDMDVENIIVSSNDTATKAAAEEGREMGLETLILSRMIEGESKEVGIVTGGIVRDIIRSGTPLKPPCLLISGGETTVRIPENRGHGGPNQEFVLGAALKIAGKSNVAIAAIDTDGTDGPTDIAGGIVDGETLERLKVRGIDIDKILKNHDAKSALERVDDVLVTGPTGTNVNDLRVAVVL